MKHLTAHALSITLLLTLCSRGTKLTGQLGAAGAPPPVMLLSETFDAPGFTARGWYDLPNDLSTAPATQRNTGGRALEWRWTPGSMNPLGTSSARHKFTPTDRVYVSYFVKYSESWVGSGRPSHPHEIMLLTTQDDDYVGPAFTHLTAYVEHNWRATGGVPVLSLQDGRNIDQSKINQSLVGLSEERAVHGCNGGGDAYRTPSTCYAVSSARYFNGRSFGDVAGPLWTNDPLSSRYKSKWHKVAAYFQLNTIANGVGQPDGLIRYWFDDVQILELPNLLLRTGRFPEMRFNQLMLGPFIGDGSPRDQTAWLDDLVVATGRMN